jgi:thiamine monophosphate synthase
MGKMVAVRILTSLMEEQTLPSNIRVTWRIGNQEEVERAEEVFVSYLADGWLAFTDEPTARQQIFEFNSRCERIILMPPLGGG